MMNDRQTKLESLRATPDLPVLIVGAGVNGIGTFRDLALQGVDVLLVDRADYCSGASSASSHMLHGGLRYLENGELRLVREALLERNRLLRNAPHLTQPLPTAIPIAKPLSGLLNAPLKLLGWRSRPAERGALVVKLGLMLYDAYVRGQSPMPSHRFFGRQALRQRWPRLAPSVRWVARYHDAMMPSPERICIEMIEDAERAHDGAMALSYMSVEPAAEPEPGSEPSESKSPESESEAGTGAGAGTGTSQVSDGVGSSENVTLRDQITGERFRVRPRVVVNAAGPWIDRANRAMGTETKLIGGTKGSHLVLDHPELREAIAGHEIFFEHRDGRIVLICPFQGRVLIGTTDLRIEDADAARCSQEEVDYLLDMVAQVFPDIPVGREQIVFRFAGVRPLPASPDGYTGNISRDHSIEVLEAGQVAAFPVLSLVGGKWTTFRAFAEQTADAVLERLGRPRRVGTADLPIGGGRDYPESAEASDVWIAGLAGRHGLPLPRARALFDRYGSRAEAVAAYLAEGEGEDEPLERLPDYSRREIAFLATREQVQHLDDLLLRRTSIAWTGDARAEVIAELAEVVGEVQGWEAGRRASEVEGCREILADRHGMVFD